MVARFKLSLSLTAIAAFVALCVWGPRTSPVLGQAPPETALSKWQSNDYPGIRYVGSARCGQCHASHLSTQALTPMARALETVEACQILRSHPRMEFHEGVYSYKIVRQGNTST